MVEWGGEVWWGGSGRGGGRWRNWFGELRGVGGKVAWLAVNYRGWGRLRNWSEVGWEPRERVGLGEENCIVGGKLRSWIVGCWVEWGKGGGIYLASRK